MTRIFQVSVRKRRFPNRRFLSAIRHSFFQANGRKTFQPATKITIRRINTPNNIIKQVHVRYVEADKRSLAFISQVRTTITKTMFNLRRRNTRCRFSGPKTKEIANWK